MIRGGQRPVPTEVHRQRGSYNPTRHGRDRAGEPKPTDDLREAPPSGLTASQRAEWRHQVQHFPAGVIKASDRRWLLIWVKAADRWDLATKALQREVEAHPDHPLQAVDRFGIWHASPLVGIIEKAEMAMARATAELGFSPAARTRIRTLPATSETAPTHEWGVKLIARG
jgi:P27 family predicted phage terminase small subunit